MASVAFDLKELECEEEEVPAWDSAPGIKTVQRADESADEYQDYVRVLGRHSLLSKARERELASQAQEGDGSARNELVCANMRLVISIAKRYLNCGLELADLVQVGSEGLIHAISKFEPLRFDTRLTTYATPWIEQYIQRALSNESRLIRIPAHRCIDVRAINRAELILGQDGHEPTEAEIAQATASDEQTVRELRLVSQTPASLDAATGDNESCLGDVIEDDNNISPEAELIDAELSENIGAALSVLPRKMRRVLELRFGLGREGGVECSLAKTAHQLKLTRAQVRQLEQEGMAVLSYKLAAFAS